MSDRSFTEASDEWKQCGGERVFWWKPEDMTLELEWKDQGWGSNKTEIKVALMRASIIVEAELFVAPHEWKKSKKSLKTCDIISNAQSGDAYGIFYKVGAAEGSELHIRRLEMVVKFSKNT